MLQKANAKKDSFRNSRITNFFIKFLVLASAWEVCYLFLLKGLRVPDKFLTDTTTSAVTFFIKLLSHGSHVYTWFEAANHTLTLIQKDGRTILSLYDDCNGLDLMVIYLSLIILLPYQLNRKILFGVGGLAIIFFTNVLRCTALYWIWVDYKSSFEFNHHYIFTILMYLLIFGGWILFTNKGKLHEAS